MSPSNALDPSRAFRPDAPRWPSPFSRWRSRRGHAAPAAAQTAGTVSVAAAADLVYCLDEMNAAFKKTHPDADLKVASGSSGNFATQIKNGAPFEVFLSADVSFPRDLIKAGLADESTLTTYATGKIVLWTTHPETVDVTKGRPSCVIPAWSRNWPLPTPIMRRMAVRPKRRSSTKNSGTRCKAASSWAKTSPRRRSSWRRATRMPGIVALSLVLSPKLAKVGKWQEIPAEDYAPTRTSRRVDQTGAHEPAGARLPGVSALA